MKVGSSSDPGKGKRPKKTARKAKARRQYKPVGFGDAYDPYSVEGHRNAIRERAEDRLSDRIARENKTRSSYRPSRMSVFMTFMGHLLRRNCAWLLKGRR